MSSAQNVAYLQSARNLIYNWLSSYTRISGGNFDPLTKNKNLVKFYKNVFRKRFTKMGDKVTIRDIAEHAGVSITTVSRVINEKSVGHMRQETKHRVLKTIERFNYTPDKIARALKKQKTEVIGVVVPDISNPFFSNLVRGIESSAYKSGYTIIICDTQSSLEKENNYIDILIKERVEGVIFIPSVTENERVTKLMEKGIHLVAADRKLRNIEAPIIMADNYQGSYELTEYLIDLGYKDIVYIKGPLNVSTAEERFQGFKQAMKDRGFGVKASRVIQGDFTVKGGYEVASRLIKSKKMSEVIVAANDMMAIGAMRALEEAGFKIPNDIGVTGFDNIPLASLVRPGLTTVDIPAFEIGKQAINILLKLAKSGERVKSTKRWKVQLVKRDSCMNKVPTNTTIK